jgi:hypothetical protein
LSDPAGASASRRISSAARVDGCFNNQTARRRGGCRALVLQSAVRVCSLSIGCKMRQQRIVVAVVAWLTALLFAPNWAGAQQPSAKIPRVGILTVEESERAPKFDAFRAGLRDLGYVEGRNIILEFRLARGDLSRGRN